MIHTIADLLDGDVGPATADDVLAIYPGAVDVVAAFNSDDMVAQALSLCLAARPYQPQPVAEAAITRQGYCLASVAAIWSDYAVKAKNGSSNQQTLDEAYQAAGTVYSFAVTELGESAKGYLDAALTSAFGPGAVGTSPPTSGLKTAKQLKGSPHKRPRPKDLATTYRDAIGAGAAVLTPTFIPIGGSYSTEEAVPAVAGCAYTPKGQDAKWRLANQLGNCQSAAVNMWRLYKQTGSGAAWKAAKAAFEMGYANARTDCSGSVCRDEYLDFFDWALD